MLCSLPQVSCMGCLISFFYPLSDKYPKVMDHFRLPRLPLSPVRSANRSRWRYDSFISPFFRVMLTSTPFCFKCTNCASACKRCDEARPCLRCQKYGLTDSCVDGVRKARKVGVKRGPYKRKSKVSAPEAAPYPGQLTPAQMMPYLTLPSRVPSYWRGTVGSPIRSTRRCPSRGHINYRDTVHATRGVLVISILSTSTWVRPATARRSCKWGQCSTRAATPPPCLLSNTSGIPPCADVSSASRGVWSYSHPIGPDAGHRTNGK